MLVGTRRVRRSGACSTEMRAWCGGCLGPFVARVGELGGRGALRGGVARSHTWEREGPTMPNWMFTEGGSTVAGADPRAGNVAQL